MHHFPLVSTVTATVFYHCRDLTTFKVYVTVCDLEKSFTFDTTAKIIGQLFQDIGTCLPEFEQVT